MGTHSLIEACKRYWGEGSENRFVHVSTKNETNKLKWMWKIGFINKKILGMSNT